MSSNQDKLAFKPETSDFTFSATTAPNAPAPIFEPRPMFYYNTPLAEKDQRGWTAEGHQLLMRETDTAPEEDPVPDPAEMASRPIAQPRAKKLSDGHGSKEVAKGNVERLAKENAFLTEQLKRERARFQTLKEDLREEQITKQAALNQLQKKVDDSEERAKKYESAFDGQRQTVARQEKQIQVIRQNHDIFLRHVEQKMAEDNPKIEQQEAIIKELQEKIESLQKIVEDTSEVEQQKVAIKELQDKSDALQKVIEDNPRIKELQIKNNALQKMVDNQQTAINEDLQNAIDTLKKEKEALQTECDALNAKLVKAEESSNDEYVARRGALMVIQSRDETIQRLEDQVGQTEQLMRAFEQDGQGREARIKEKEAALKVARAEVSNLNTVNSQLNQDNVRVKSQNEKLAKVLQEYHAEIERLQAVTEELKDVESELAEVTAGAVQTKAELLSMEAINRRLKLKIEEGRQPFARAGKADNLDHELSGSDFESISSDEESEIREDTFTLGNSPEVTTPREIQDIIESQVVIAPQDATSHSSITAIPGGQVSPSSTVSRGFAYSSISKGTASATEFTQTPAVTATTATPEFSPHQELTQTPAITVASIIPDETTSAELRQTLVIPVASITPGTTISPNITLSQVATVDTITPDDTLPAIIVKHHSPLECWLQVYRDLWILFSFWFNHYLNNTHQGPDLKDNEEGTAPVEGGAAGTTHQVTSLPDVVSAAIDTDPILMEFEEAKTEILDIWITIPAFLFHLFFYAVVIICISNYRSILRERSVWLQANDNTRQYFQDIYKIPFQPDSNIYRQLFGQVEFFDLLRYYVHIWTKISRSLPG